MTQTERTIRAILKYTGAAESHSALSTVHMLANEALEEYLKESAAKDSKLIALEVIALEDDCAPTPTANNAHLHEM